MKRFPVVSALAALTVVSTAALGAPDALGAVHSPGHSVARTQTKGSPGTWTKVSTGTVGVTYVPTLVPTLVRTGDGILHLVYPKDVSGAAQLGHTALHTDGSIARQNNVLPSGWSVRDPAPVVVSTAAGLRVMFGGIQSVNPGFWSDGRMYTATSTSTGAAWNLPSEAVGISHQADASYGTGATTLGDGTPVAAFPLNSTLTWHVGTSSAPDQSYTSSQCCLYHATLVRDGSSVWAGWYENGSTAATSGTFVMRIYPTVGLPLKAPGSSVGSDSLPTGRVALAARTGGGGVYVAYCAGWPTCTAVRLWKVGTSRTANVPRSRFASTISLSPGPSGRLWVAWADNLPKVRAVRTGRTGLVMGAEQTPGLPRGAGAAYSLAIDGTRGRGDIVVNVGNAFWHTQVRAGLTLRAAPAHWRHGSRQRVVFTVSDAHEAVRGARVKVGSSACTTGAHGTCPITFSRTFGRGRHTARATRAGYAAATTGLRVG